MKVPSPATVQRRIRNRTRVAIPLTVDGHLSTLFRQLDLSPFPVNAGDENSSSVRFSSLLQVEPLATDVVKDWLEVLALAPTSKNLTAAEAILFEWMLCWDPGPIAAALPGKFNYLKTVHTSRQRAAIALHDYARAVNWRRPIVHLAALRVARAYLRAVVANEAMTRDDLRREFTGRLGVGTVLMSRFIEIPRSELVEAVECLARSIEQGNTTETAFEYWLEGQTRLFDLSRDRHALDLAAHRVLEEFPTDVPPLLIPQLVDMALRLDEPALIGLSSFHELPGMLSNLRGNHSLPIEVALRTLLTEVLVRESLNRGLPLVSTNLPRLPFDLRKSNPDPVLISFFPSMIGAINGSGEIRSEPLALSLTADLLQHLHGTDDATAEQLRERIRLRTWPGYRDQDDRNSLLRLRDQLFLAQREGDQTLRGEALNRLLDFAEERPSTAASALTLIARDVGAHGACSLTFPQHPTFAASVGAGDADALLAGAAAAAERSPDLFLVELGGRSNVTSVGDLYDLVGETFIFKEVYLDALHKEEARVSLLAQKLEEDGLSEQFAVTSQRLLREDDNRPARGVAVRRYEQGKSARDFLEVHPDQTELVLTRIAHFLGWMNQAEGVSATQTGRRAILTGELGMWLKTLGHDAHAEFFARWWGSFDSVVPGAPRRDAHLDNWILSSSGKVVAIDLEARFNRPLGYELAQLTEDSGQLAPDDWSTRSSVLRAYAEALGSPYDADTLRSPYEASVLARAVRHLTMPRDNGRYVTHGLGVLECLRESASTTVVREQADEVLSTFLRTRGSIESFVKGTEMTPAQRRRLSKRLAYLLRHSTTIARDLGGWVPIAEVSEGLAVSTATVVEVACHVDERRFEVSGESIRARYGHSLPADLEYQAYKLTNPLLYHGTSITAAEQILWPTGGIKRMERQWVHLATEFPDAYVAALRKGEPVVLAVIATGLAKLWSATESTVLTPYVPPDRTRVAPVSLTWAMLPPLEAELMSS